MTKQFKPATHRKCDTCLDVSELPGGDCKCSNDEELWEDGTLESDLEAACRKAGIDTAGQIASLVSCTSYLSSIRLELKSKRWTEWSKEILDKLDNARENDDG